jgi:7-carboxy-7-deazaguanine synthase
MVHEIYASVQGEGTHVGLPCVFVRTSTCNLRCRWCDTRQAFGPGEVLQLPQVLARIAALGPRLCLITGGEPLVQPATLPLMAQLADAGYTVLLETSGSVPIDRVDPRVVRIVDMKAPGSGEVQANRYDQLAGLRPHDEVKFVLADADDYAWATALVQEHRLVGRCSVLFGPAHGQLTPRELVEWIMRDRLAVRMQVQLHKYIWDAQTQGV